MTEWLENVAKVGVETVGEVFDGGVACEGHMPARVHLYVGQVTGSLGPRYNKGLPNDPNCASWIAVFDLTHVVEAL